jgi:hypothetical protein
MRESSKQQTGENLCLLLGAFSFLTGKKVLRGVIICPKKRRWIIMKCDEI